MGEFVFVSGTTATAEDGSTVGKGDPVCAGRVQALKNIEATLLKLGATLQDMVRTRMYVVNIDQRDQVCRAHGEFFQGHSPGYKAWSKSAASSPRKSWFEIEADAVVSS